MSARDLPEKLQRRITAIERLIRRKVIVRAARWPQPHLRGRIGERAGAVVVEYKDETAGYFWDIDLINELLDYVEQGCFEVILVDEDTRSISQPPEIGLEE